MSERIKFVGIDYWNRPVFQSLTKKSNFYGSLHKLFDYNSKESEVLRKVSKEDLCYFGNNFDCEPYGTPAVDIKIVREKDVDIETEFKDELQKVYGEMLRRLDIESGDIEPTQLIKLEEAEDQLTAVVASWLKSRMEDTNE